MKQILITIRQNAVVAQLAETAEYTDCISAER